MLKHRHLNRSGLFQIQEKQKPKVGQVLKSYTYRVKDIEIMKTIT